MIMMKPPKVHPPRLQSFPLFFTLFSEHHFQALANWGIDVSFLTKRRAMVICMLHMLLLLTSGNTMRFPNSKHLHAQLNFPRGIGVGPNKWKSAMWHKLGKLVIWCKKQSTLAYLGACLRGLNRWDLKCFVGGKGWGRSTSLYIRVKGPN